MYNVNNEVTAKKKKKSEEKATNKTKWASGRESSAACLAPHAALILLLQCQKVQHQSMKLRLITACSSRCKDSIVAYRDTNRFNETWRWGIVVWLMTDSHWLPPFHSEKTQLFQMMTVLACFLTNSSNDKRNSRCTKCVQSRIAIILSHILLLCLQDSYNGL